MSKDKSGPLLHVTDIGRGPPVVLIQGLARTSHHWLQFAKSLAHENLRVITLDPRGIGANQKMPGWSLTIRDMSLDVIEVLDKLGIDKAHILGVSLGGMVALDLGISRPERCQSLTIVNSSIMTVGNILNRLSLRAIMFLLRNALDRDNRADFAKDLVDIVVGIDMPDDDRKVLAMEFARLEKRYPTKLKVVLMQILAAARFSPQKKLNNLKIPSQIIAGGCDFFVPKSNSVLIHKYMPQAKMHVIPAGGHELMYDKSQILIELICNLINRTERRMARLQKSV